MLFFYEIKKAAIDSVFLKRKKSLIGFDRWTSATCRNQRNSLCQGLRFSIII